MRIKILGKPSKLSKKETRFAAHFFAEKLLSKKISKNIDLTIRFTNLGSNHPGAECGWEDTNIRPKEFEIAIDRNWGRRAQLINLAHEMVHVKQYATGELMDFTSEKLYNYSKWRNVKYLNEEHTYWDQPWEIDAYGRELGLYKKYQHHLKITKVKFV